VIAAGSKVIVTKSNDDFEYFEGDRGTVETVELKPSSSGGPVKMALVVYDYDQDPGWVHLDSLETR
jgi:hypothetical protein